MLDYDWEKCMLSRKNDIQIKMLRSHYNSVGYMDRMAYKKKNKSHNQTKSKFSWKWKSGVK